MARRVYFAFDYKDVFAVNQIRRSSQFVPVAVAGFADASQWEKLKQLDPAKVKGAIDRALERTSVTVAIIGERTAKRRYVNYELRASCARGNGLLGVYLPGMRDFDIPPVLLQQKAPVVPVERISVRRMDRSGRAPRTPMTVECADSDRGLVAAPTRRLDGHPHGRL